MTCLGAVARDVVGSGPKKVLVVSDAGVMDAGHTLRGIELLNEAGFVTRLFCDFTENPNTDQVEAGRRVAGEFQPDLLVGLGGGSSLDCCKGINFLHTSGGRMQDYWGKGKATAPMLPMIAVPTTAGTGSEAQSFALISDAQTRQKMACGDKKAACRAAILDPELTITQPPQITALTGIDAISHAVESYVSTAHNAASRVFSREAFAHLAANFDNVLAESNNMVARGNMQWGACLAGMAIENSMLGAAHALANPLTAQFDVPHGQAVGVALPHVVQFNGEDPDVSGDYERLAAIGVDELADRIVRWLTAAGLKTRLADLGVDRRRFPQLAEEAAAQWTGTFNPRGLTPADFQRLYEQAW